MRPPNTPIWKSTVPSLPIPDPSLPILMGRTLITHINHHWIGPPPTTNPAERPLKVVFPTTLDPNVPTEPSRFEPIDTYRDLCDAPKPFPELGLVDLESATEELEQAWCFHDINSGTGPGEYKFEEVRRVLMDDEEAVGVLSRNTVRALRAMVGMLPEGTEVVGVQGVDFGLDDDGRDMEWAAAAMDRRREEALEEWNEGVGEAQRKERERDKMLGKMFQDPQKLMRKRRARRERKEKEEPKSLAEELAQMEACLISLIAADSK